MSVSRPLARLLRQPRLAPGAAVRPFSTTPLRPFPRRRPSPKDAIAAANASAPAPLSPRTAPYTPAEIEELEQHYSPEQLSALLAGEAAISRKDFESQKVDRRNDAFNLGYLDDLSSIDGILDFPQGGLKPYRAQVLNKASPKTSTFEIPQQPLPLIEDPGLEYRDSTGETTNQELAKHLGFTTQQVRGIFTKQLVMHGVTNQTRMGKIRKVYCLYVAGNGNGLIGIGEGKAVEVDEALEKARLRAIKNLKPIPRYENRTIYGDVEVKVGAVEMKLMTRPPGFGIRCSQYIYEMCKAAGIKDLSARVTRSRNPMNVIKTFMHALNSQRLPETIARGRGKKFVDVRNVYYSGRFVRERARN